MYPLAEYWPVRGRHYRERISVLPTGYIRWALENLCLVPSVRAALLAENGFRIMAHDQQEGRI